MGKWGNAGIFTHIPAYSGIFRDPDLIRHIQEYSRIILPYPEPCITTAYLESWYIQNQRHIQKSGVSKTLALSERKTFSESWAVQKPGIMRTGGILTTLTNIYDGVLCKTAIIIFASYNYFCSMSFSCPLVYEISMIFLMQV